MNELKPPASTAERVPGTDARFHMGAYAGRMRAAADALLSNLSAKQLARSLTIMSSPNTIGRC